MLDRDYFVGTRIADSHYNSLKTAADDQALTIAEWVRLAVVRRITGEASTSRALVQELLAIRIMLLNLLFAMGPDGANFGRQRLQNLPRRADESSQTQVQRLFPAPPAGGPGGPTRHRTVKVRLNKTQHETVKLNAAAAGITVSEWLRDAVVVQLQHDALPKVLKQRVLAVCLILDASIATVTAEGGRLDQTVMADLSKRTDPAPAWYGRGRNS